MVAYFISNDYLSTQLSYLFITEENAFSKHPTLAVFAFAKLTNICVILNARFNSYDINCILRTKPFFPVKLQVSHDYIEN